MTYLKLPMESCKDGQDKLKLRFKRYCVFKKLVYKMQAILASILF